MTKTAFKKWSLLGLVLTSVSAVTAAVIPSSKSTISDGNCAGPDATDAQVTCTAAIGSPTPATCDRSVAGEEGLASNTGITTATDGAANGEGDGCTLVP